MFSFQATREGGVDGSAVDLAFTDRRHDLAVAADPENLRLVTQAFVPDAEQPAVVGLHQVHGAEVAVVDESYDGRELVADALVTTVAGPVLLVRAADCVPVLLADTDNRVIAAVHSGRSGLVAGVVPAAVQVMRDLGATDISAWIGPHVCGRCYEVPDQMRAEVAALVPESHAETSWGTPALDIGAGVRAQLRAHGVSCEDVARCTREDDELWSFRREGAGAGRLGGLIRIRP
ncbi:polyphenol oxidase family protein [Nocardioides jensenii]|uniref:polyphenol oxidase family protein n=1 Tax=Nocardioides jensenii TaxID=1843 RepID=UPI0008336717|nr:polyphenol oxidase family protein [Nocardioides jensenii]